MAELVTLIIDGREVSVPKGTLIAEAAKKLGIEIPVFCYHPKLEPVGMCRMCLVEVGNPRRGKDGQIEVDAEGKPVIAMIPKLQTACTVPVSPGMVVKTNTQVVQDARRTVLEFLLTSHPLDCPVCDKGGECPLQELTFAYGPGVSRFPVESKFQFTKPVPLSDLIMLDRERCILCSRCIRFQDEIADDPVLGFKDRGRGMEIVTFSNPPFDSKWSGNTTDICPVGALTSRDFRFQARPWELTNTASVCPHCSVGCNIAISHRYQDIKRIMPRENDAVNEIWICDKGRFAHHFVNSPERLSSPLIRREGQLEPASWDEALELIAQRFGEIKAQAGADALGGLAGDRAANEDLYLFQKFLRTVIGTNNIDHRAPAASRNTSDDTIYRLGVASGTDLGKLGKETAIFVIGADPDEEQPVLWLKLKKSAQRGGAPLVVANPQPTRLDRYARHTLHYRYGSEAHLVAALLNAVLEFPPSIPPASGGVAGAESASGGVAGVEPASGGEEEGQDFAARLDGLEALREAVAGYSPARVATETGITESDLNTVARLLAESPNLVILYGRAAMTPAVENGLANLALVTGHVGRVNNGLVALLPHNNSQGAADMGLFPDRLPGYMPLDEAQARARLSEIWGAPVPEKLGLGTAQMLDCGTLKGLYILGADPAIEYPESRQTLESINFLVVQDLFLTTTAQQAHVVLPAQSFAERAGTFTNTERRVQLFYPAFNLPLEARPDWQILNGLAARMGRWFNHASPSDIMAEIRRVVPIYANLTDLELGLPQSKGRRPRSSIIHLGTRFEYLGGLGHQWPVASENSQTRFKLVWIEPEINPDLQAPDSDSSFPFILIPVVRLFDRGTMISKSEILQSVIPSPHIEINPDDAATLGITDGDRVRVRSSRLEIETEAWVQEHAPRGVILVPANLDGPERTLLRGKVQAVRVSVTKVLQPVIAG